MPYNSSIKHFMNHNFRHFNARSTLNAAKDYCTQIKLGNAMLVSIAGAMSTGEIGITLSKMIKENKVHAICCTGANLEEEIFYLIAKKSYKILNNWRNLTLKEEDMLAKQQLNRVTDTCIPEDAIITLKNIILNYWIKAEKNKKSYSPYEFIYQIINSGILNKYYDGSEKESWVLAACEKKIPIFTPGWEDSTLGNIFIANHILGKISNIETVKTGLHQMKDLIEWYVKTTKKRSIGFFQIGGGIAGDYAISAVPLIKQDLGWDVPLWSYFCQISDSTTSYGSYSGAFPSEKITWGKIGIDTPQHIIESDASIIAPLIFSYVLNI